MGGGVALAALFKLVLPMFMGIIILWRIVKAGSNKAKRKIAETELDDKREFAERGEEWDGRGSLGGIVRRRLRK